MDKTTDDMNLFDFLLLCWAAVKRLFRGIILLLMQTIRLGLQYLWVVLIGIAFGIGAAWFLTRDAQTKFTGKVTVYVTEGMKHTVMDGISQFFTSGDVSRCEHHGIPKEYARMMRGVVFRDVIDAKNDSIPDYIDSDNDVSVIDSMRTIMPDRFEIRMTMKGNGNFTPFMHAFRMYLNEQEAIRRADTIYKRIAHDKLARLDREVARLDSFITYNYFDHPRHYDLQGTNIIAERTPQPYTDHLLALTKHRDFVRAQVERTPDIINYRSHFILERTPPIYYYFWGLIAGGILGLLLALLVKYRRPVFDYLRRKS